MKIQIAIPRTQNIFLPLSVFFFSLFGQSCGTKSLPPPTQTPFPSFTPISEEAETSDCLWTATGRAWKDNNQNGVWNSGEKPLAGVNFWVDDLLNDFQKVNEFPADRVATNLEGRVEISVWLPGCSDIELEVYTEAPQNCKLTTPERIPVNPDSQYPVYSFGFICR
jgi:hypothetical protein